MSEREIQRQIVDTLRKAGCVVCVTSNRHSTANTPGTPDLFVWRAGVWKALEVKSLDGKLSPRQDGLATAGAVRVVRSVDEALEAVGLSH